MAKKYFWSRCYELGRCDELEDLHWALCDNESAKEGRVSDYNMVLHSTSEKCIDERPLPEQDLPKRIVGLLNRDEVTREKAQRLADAWKEWADAEGWDNEHWDGVFQAVDDLLSEFGIERTK